jgi:hypothetical protein
MAVGRQMGKELNDVAREPQPKPVAPFVESVEKAQQRPLPFRVETVRFWEDGSIRVAWVPQRSIELLPEALSMKTVQERMGKPETIKRIAVDNERGARPVVLTLYSYVDGAVVYAENDFAPTPGFVDRVILRLTSVIRTVFQEER